jgi:hypothetical protein
MEQERELMNFRARLLDGLKVSVRRSACGASDPIQVFVNERRVGFLERGGTEATLQLQSAARIDNVRLRSEDGVLLGGLSAPEHGFRSTRIPLSRDAVELHVHNNTAQGGSASVQYIPAPARWRRRWQALSGAANSVVRRPVASLAPGMRFVAFTQAVLAVIVVGLVGERMGLWMTSANTPAHNGGTETVPTASRADVATLERQLGEIARIQAKAVETMQVQQQDMTDLHQAMEKLFSIQERLESSVLTVRQDVNNRQKSANREVNLMTRLLMSKARAEQEQLEAEIHSLTVANERLAKEVAGLEQHNQDLEQKLRSAGVDVSKAPVSDHSSPMMAQQAEALSLPSPPTLADVEPQPLLFWVNFSEGTSQESIDEWVREMEGHREAFIEGWHEVRIVQPPLPPDRFLEQIKGAKIVKAVRISQ